MKGLAQALRLLKNGMTEYFCFASSQTTFRGIWRWKQNGVNYNEINVVSHSKAQLGVSHTTEIFMCLCVGWKGSRDAGSDVTLMFKISHRRRRYIKFHPCYIISYKFSYKKRPSRQQVKAWRCLLLRNWNKICFACPFINRYYALSIAKFADIRASNVPRQQTPAQRSI